MQGLFIGHREDSLHLELSDDKQYVFVKSSYDKEKDQIFDIKVWNVNTLVEKSMGEGFEKLIKSVNDLQENNYKY